MPQHVKVDASGFQSAECLAQHVLATRTRNRGSSRPSGRTGGAVALWASNRDCGECGI